MKDGQDHTRSAPEPAWVKVSEDRLLLYHVETFPGGGIRGILSQFGVGSDD